jgi:hypothetical protein
MRTCVESVRAGRQVDKDKSKRTPLASIGERQKAGIGTEKRIPKARGRAAVALTADETTLRKFVLSVAATARARSVLPRRGQRRRERLSLRFPLRFPR